MCYAAQKPLAAYNAPCVTPCGLGRLLGAAAQPFAPVGPELPSAVCCTRPLCGRLRFVIICPKPWTALPGATSVGSTDYMRRDWSPNQTPGRGQVPITGGTPWCLQLAGSPVAVNMYDELPLVVQEAYPGFKYRSIVFDFGTAKAGRAEGKLVAMGGGGCIQACMKFKYRWCGPFTCRGVTKPQFEVTSNTGVNARFTVLDPSFLSSDPCTESIVVLQIQQWCCDKTRCRTARAPGQEVLDAPWSLGPLNCLEKALVPSCTRPCLAEVECPGSDECCPRYVEDVDPEWADCGDGICRERCAAPAPVRSRAGHHHGREPVASCSRYCAPPCDGDPLIK
jgi:hypothetical protein